MVQQVESTANQFSREKNDDFSDSEKLKSPLFDYLNARNLNGVQSLDVAKNNVDRLEAMYDGLPPLRLNLKKSPSFVHMVEMQLNQSNDEAEINQSTDSCQCRQQAIDKVKASNFRAYSLQIGSWTRVTKHEGDLIAKCYYAKRKLMWEFLEGPRKMKIEVPWSDILGITANLEENQPGVLEVELREPPSFYREQNPQPRRHTSWENTIDFTGGQAQQFRRHRLVCPPGALNRPYEQLLQCDSRLFNLSQRPFPSLPHPYFSQDPYEHKELSINFREQPPLLSHATALVFPSSTMSPRLNCPFRTHRRNQLPFWTTVSDSPISDHSRINEPNGHARALSSRMGMLGQRSNNVVDTSPPVISYQNSYQNPSMAIWGQEMNNFGGSFSTPALNDFGSFMNQGHQAIPHQMHDQPYQSETPILDDLEAQLVRECLESWDNNMSNLGRADWNTHVMDNNCVQDMVTDNSAVPTEQLSLIPPEYGNGGVKMVYQQPAWVPSDQLLVNQSEMMHHPVNNMYYNPPINSYPGFEDFGSDSHRS